MATAQQVVVRVAFGLFEADLQSSELWKAGHKIKLQSQPFKVLTALVERPGEVVTREELQTRLWGKDAIGDFDHSIGTAINKIREALGDTADNPRFVETLARRGYRWIAPVTVLASRATDHSPASAAPAPAPEPRPRLVDFPPESLHRSATAPRWKGRLLAGVALVAAFSAAGSLLLVRLATPTSPLLRITQLTRNGRIAPGMPAMESLPAGVTDGLRLYVPVLSEGRSILSQIDIHTGAVQALSVPQEIPSPSLGDLSPDGSTMLLRSHLSPESELPLWTVPTSGGSALRLANVVGHDATWMPDGKSVLYASGNQLIVAHLTDGTQTPFATLPGRAFWLRWSPDHKLLRFTLLDPIAHTTRLGEIGSDGKGLRTLFDGWTSPSSECCGTWTGDGRYFVFQSNHGNTGTADLWRADGKATSGAVRVTNGPMSYVGPIAPHTGERVYFIGLESQSVLQRFEPAKGQFVPAAAFLADAARVEYTRDGRWVTWTDTEGRQWRAHADGSEMIRLTPDSLQVFLGKWSPDGSHVALMAHEPGRAWRIYIVGAEGGAPEPVLAETRNEADPSWSADGRQIVFGRVTDVMGKEEGARDLEIVDLATKIVTPVPGSTGLFSSRWSPDGRYLAALSLDQRSLMLYDTSTKTWRVLAQTTAADPVWAADSKAIFFHASLAEMQPIYRLALNSTQPQQIASLSSFAGGTTADYFFCGLTPDEVPIVRTRTATGNLYSIDLAER